ncbi:MAG: hypothetical protein KBF57_05075 [Saprospiraceae bacterium]|nr:hypothetical protein [Saprospiraceae bacterium]
MISQIRYLFVFGLISIAVMANGQNDTVKVIGTLFAKKMVDAAAQQGLKDQVLVSDSMGYLYFKDSGINYPVPVEIDSIEQLDSLQHKTGLIAIVKNNGSFVSNGEKWLRLSCNLRLSNTRQLRKLKRQSCPVYVQAYYDSLHYGGGFFNWAAYDILGNGDDGGNVFAALDSGYWIREKVEFIPSNYGAVDSTHQRFSDYMTSSDALQRCINSAGKNGAVQFDNGFVYNNAGTLILKEGQILDARNATLRRINRIRSTIIAHNAGSNVIYVADSTLFEIGMSIVAKIGNDYSYSYNIVEKSGDKLTLYASMALLNNQIVSFSGAEIFTSSYQISAVQPNVRIENLMLDGNKDGNMLDNRWEYSGELYLQSENGKFMNLSIANSSGESINLFGNNPLLRNITVVNGNGNGIHLGSNNRYTIDNVRIENVNLLAMAGDYSLGHEGGAIAFSDNVHGGLVHNVYVENALAVVGGINGEDDSNNSYDKLTGINCTRAFEIKQVYGGNKLKDIQISNSKFINCSKLEITSNLNTPVTNAARNIRLRNVDLVNTSLLIANVDSLFLDWILFSASSAENMINLDFVYNSTVSNLKMSGGKNIYINQSDNLLFSNLDVASTFGSNAINAANSAGYIQFRNGSVKHDNCPSGYRGIYAGPKTIIDNILVNLNGPAQSGIEMGTSVEARAGIVRNCNIITSLNVPSIKCFAGTQNNYMLNNIVNRPMLDNGDNFEIGTILITD